MPSIPRRQAIINAAKLGLLTLVTDGASAQTEDPGPVAPKVKWIKPDI